ncbi:unnamed protein product [Sphagnum troendelagicum]
MKRNHIHFATGLPEDNGVISGHFMTNMASTLTVMANYSLQEGMPIELDLEIDLSHLLCRHWWIWSSYQQWRVYGNKAPVLAHLKASGSQKSGQRITLVACLELGNKATYNPYGILNSTTLSLACLLHTLA